MVRWDELALLTFINTELAPLDASLSMATLDRADPGFLAVTERAKIEEQQVGLAGLRQVERAATTLYHQAEAAKVSGIANGGLVSEFERAVAGMLSAQQLEKSERVKAADSIFANLWAAAERIFAEGAEAIQTCPLCDTPIANTKAGSSEGIRQHVATHLEQLHDYATAKKQLGEAERRVSDSKTHLLAGLQAMLPLITGIGTKVENAVASYSAAVQAWSVGITPDSTPLKALLGELTTALADRITKIESEQGERTYSKAHAQIERLIELKNERLLAEETIRQLGIVSASLTEQASSFRMQFERRWRLCSIPCGNPQTKSIARYRGWGLFQFGSNYRPKRI